MESIGPIITIVGSVLLAILKMWQDGAPQRKQEEADAQTQENRRALIGGDAGLVERRLDGLLDAGNGGDAGSSGGADQSGRKSINDRLADFGISAG